MYKKQYFIPAIALITSLLLASPISPTLAASPSPSPSPVDNTSTVNENLKQRLKESLTTPEVSEISSTNNKGYIGKIKDIIKDTVIMQDKDGKKDLKLTSGTVIVRSPGNATIKPEDIRIDDYIIAIGTLMEADILEAKRLIVSIDPIQNSSKTSGYGTISKLSKNSLIVLVDGAEKIVSLTAKTIYKSSVAAIDFTDISISDTIIYTATLDEDDLLTSSVIMRVKTAALGE